MIVILKALGEIMHSHAFIPKEMSNIDKGEDVLSLFDPLEHTPILGGSLGGKIYLGNVLVNTFTTTEDESRFTLIKIGKPLVYVTSGDINLATGEIILAWTGSLSPGPNHVAVEYEYPYEPLECMGKFPAGTKLTAEYFRDKIKPPAPPEFEIGSHISPEDLAKYINKSNLDPESFYRSGRSERVGDYILEREKCSTINNPDKIFLRYNLMNYSHQGECTENGIVECRKYVFIVKTDYLECVSYCNNMSGFYDQMYLSEDGKSITIYV